MGRWAQRHTPATHRLIRRHGPGADVHRWNHLDEPEQRPARSDRSSDRTARSCERTLHRRGDDNTFALSVRHERQWFRYGLTISNTTADPFGAPHVDADATGFVHCTLTFFGPGDPFAVTTASVRAGTTYANTLSVIAPNFQGYMIATCNFPLGHGFAFISDPGARNLAMGYLPTNICSPRLPSQ